MLGWESSCAPIAVQHIVKKADTRTENILHLLALTQRDQIVYLGPSELPIPSSKTIKTTPNMILNHSCTDFHLLWTLTDYNIFSSKKPKVRKTNDEIEETILRRTCQEVYTDIFQIVLQRLNSLCQTFDVCKHVTVEFFSYDVFCVAAKVCFMNR